MTGAVRSVRTEDIPALAAMERAVFPSAAGEEWLLRMLSDGRHAFFLYEEGGEMAGYAWYEFVLDEGSVGSVAVAQAYRRRGIGRALTEAMLADALARGLATLTLEVREGNAPARALYERCGFRKVGRRNNYYERPKEDALLMTAVL